MTALAGLTVFVYFAELSAWNSDKITGRGIASKRDNGNADRLENFCTRCQERFIWQTTVVSIHKIHIEWQ